MLFCKSDFPLVLEPVQIGSSHEPWGAAARQPYPERMPIAVKHQPLVFLAPDLMFSLAEIAPYTVDLLHTSSFIMPTIVFVLHTP